ncbi:efflux RND transporter periplasmic adaptor subunit [Hyalangium rubrum]|uniref:Efflux RND transporter periplasmic adaptor subunit n=1 Tax=Hyalangium rubrum TaxID=3103134 RepID=A0ABU5HIS2_9BACT|nr:efflux RND transporter periplasmic adaptor subunit [Hyalangium sp. s54d21]MDY7233049.1 efflux RND transporter periplasmic adaptor subunit [Hyalangium sp. s54d21]
MKASVKSVVVAVAVAAAGCGGSSKSAPPPAAAQVAQKPVGVKALTPAPQLEASVLRATGSVRSKQEATLSAQGSGTLMRVSVKVGERVKRGQVLAQLDTSNTRIAADQARAAKAAADAALDGATTEVERARALTEAGSLARASLDKAEVGYRQAQAQAAQAAAALANANEVLRDATLTAPFDGVITSRNRNEGDYVSTGTAIFGLVNTQELEVRVPVPEAFVDRVKQGSVVKGTISPSGAPFEARVASLGATIDSQTRTVEVLADVLPAKETGGVQLRAGALVELDFSAAVASEGEPGQAGLFLPSQAVQAQGQQGFVWVVQDGKAQRRDVKVERVLPGFVRVVQGLGAEERVVADASLPLQNGTALQVVQ